MDDAAITRQIIQHDCQNDLCRNKTTFKKVLNDYDNSKYICLDSNSGNCTAAYNMLVVITLAF